VLDTIEREGLCERAQALGESLQARLETLKRYSVVREVRGRGVLRGVEFTKEGRIEEPFPELGVALKRTAVDNGLILRVDPNWFAVSPALVCSESDLDEMFDLIDKSVDQAFTEVHAAGARR
jgi:2,2-dialkylglycine decarboxylase (pyruvate)